MKKLLLNFINFYQAYLSFDNGVLSFFAPGGACKYQISCSEYAKQMVTEYGAVKGLMLGGKRVWSCR